MSSPVCDFDEINLDLDPQLLAVLEQYDADAALIPTIPAGPGDDLLNGEEQPPRLKSKSWHQRRREEILRLREEVKDLSARLLQLRTNPRLDKAKDSSVSSETPLALVSADGKPSTWEEVASFEFKQRQSSEEENSALRNLLKQHMRQAKLDVRVLKRRMVEQPTHHLVKRHRLDSTNFPPPNFNRVVFEDLMSGLDGVYVDVDKLFENVEIACPGRQRIHKAKMATKNHYLELVDCYAVPFGLHHVESAIWSLKTTSAGESNSVFSEYVAVEDNTRLKNVCTVVTRRGLEMRIVLRAAVRKYVEEDRTIIISRMELEPIHELFSITFKETSCLVLTNGKPSATGPTTVMKTYCHVSVMGDVHPSWEDSPYYDSGIEAWDQALTQFNHKVEDICCVTLAEAK